MNSSPTVTVVIPTFNRSAELERALDSLAAQTDPQFAVFVCDDGSAEDIQSVVDRYARRLDIVCQRIDNSGGPARPRNIGIQQATTDWVSFLDSDDWWHPERMAAVKSRLDETVDVVYHRLQVTRAASSSAAHQRVELIGDPLRDEEPLTHMLRFGNPLPTSATLVRTALMREVGGFDDSRALASVEDFDAWLRLAAKGARFAFVPRTLGCYWVGDDNISAFTPRQYERQRTLFERQLTLLPQAHRRRARSNFSYLLGSYELLLGLPDHDGHLRQVELSVEPIRWLKARLKLARRFVRSFARAA
jgi:glycosyltransferase involved in cell wall biosynthesis